MREEQGNCEAAGLGGLRPKAKERITNGRAEWTELESKSKFDESTKNGKRIRMTDVGGRGFRTSFGLRPGGEGRR